MCSAGALIGIGAGVGLFGSYMGYRGAASAAKQQGRLAMQNAALQQQQYMMQSAFQAMQAQALMAQSGAFMSQASAFMQQADIAARTGEILQDNQMYRAAQAERERDEAARRASEMRRQLIGGGKVTFAANGVLLESRPQSAVAMWEQDEVADLAFELSGIKRVADNEIFGFVMQGYQDRMQGLFNAEALHLQAEGAKIEAGNARINAAGSMAQSRISLINGQLAILGGQATVAQLDAAADAALWNFIGSIGGLGMSVGLFAAGGGFSGKAAQPSYPGITNSPENLLTHTYSRNQQQYMRH